MDKPGQSGKLNQWARIKGSIMMKNNPLIKSATISELKAKKDEVKDSESDSSDSSSDDDSSSDSDSSFKSTSRNLIN